jgi:hypothetical protein
MDMMQRIQQQPDAQPAPEPAPLTLPPSPRPDCSAATCGEAPVAQWLRRLTDDELTVELAIEQGRRDNAYLLRDVQMPPPVFGPMPTSGDYARTVYACSGHAISLDAAALVHQAHCPGPDHGQLPDCGCTPEQPHAANPAPAAEWRGPAHWRTEVGDGPEPS